MALSGNVSRGEIGGDHEQSEDDPSDLNEPEQDRVPGSRDRGEKEGLTMSEVRHGPKEEEKAPDGLNAKESRHHEYDKGDVVEETVSRHG